MPRPSTPRRRVGAPRTAAAPGQIVLVQHGGGALGAYQVGVDEALHEAGTEPNWVVGTSDHTKDIDFTPAGIRARWRAGYEDARRFLERAPWRAPTEPLERVVIPAAN